MGVSIPIGFSSSLQPMPWLVYDTAVPEFQSLSGFQVRCNSDQSVGPLVHLPVSIPIGFSSSLQRRDSGIMGSHPQAFQSLSGFQVRCNMYSAIDSNAIGHVSIPIGFSSSLQQKDNGDIKYAMICFNPYRVFKFAAT